MAVSGSRNGQLATFVPEGDVNSVGCIELSEQARNLVQSLFQVHRVQGSLGDLVEQQQVVGALLQLLVQAGVFNCQGGLVGESLQALGGIGGEESALRAAQVEDADNLAFNMDWGAGIRSNPGHAGGDVGQVVRAQVIDEDGLAILDQAAHEFVILQGNDQVCIQG